MIFVSTGGFARRKPCDVCREFIDNDIGHIELSAGLYSDDTVDKLAGLKNGAKFMVHNYFPPPKQPFCINLASLDPMVSRMSLNHCLLAIDTARQLASGFYSFHAGFMFDPPVDELGEKMTGRALYDEEQATEIFLENVNRLSNHAAGSGIRLLIENNVISRENFESFNGDPFLMTTPAGCKYIMENTPGNVNLVVDLGHLNVSANVMEFEAGEFLALCDPWITGYHLSDNDGHSDSNLQLGENSWFWPHLNRDAEFFTLEIFNAGIPVIKEQLKLVGEKIHGC